MFLHPVGPDGQRSVQARQQFPETVWVEPAYRCAAADGCKTTTIFSAFKNCSKIQYAVATDLVDSKKLQVVVTTATGGTG